MTFILRETAFQGLGANIDRWRWRQAVHFYTVPIKRGPPGY
jgi:hypothetical protein